MSTHHIMVVEDSELTLFKLKAILIRLGYQVTVHTNPSEAIKELSQPGKIPDLIISDVEMPEMNGYDFTRQVRSNPATTHTPIILLTSHAEISEKLAGLQAGADDFLGKTVSPTELELRIKALLSRSQTQEGNFSQAVAKTFSVFSLRGGVGTTSVAVNLSIALAHLWGIETTLWDMALSGGHCAFFLKLKPTNTLAAMADLPANSTIDSIEIEKFLYKHESGIRLLAAPLSPSEAELVTPATINLLWSYLQANSIHLVVDAGNHFTEPVLDILERSDFILLMLSPELASVKSAYDALQILDGLGIEPKRILPIVNYTIPAQRIPLKRISAALQKGIAAAIPYDSEACIQAINNGEPFVITAPKSEISRAILTLAYKLSAKEMETSHQHGHTGALLDGIRKLATNG